MKKSLVDDLIEDKEQDKVIIKTFHGRESLSSDIFEKTQDGYLMTDKIRDKLLEISDDFISSLGVDFFIYDVILTGSLCNYNWSIFSDIDLHIIINIEDILYNEENNTPVIQSVVKEFLKTKKDQWNKSNIKIKNYDVEVYTQDINEKHISSGVFSILNNQWIVEPKKEKNFIDDRKILEKGEEYSILIDDLIEKSKLGELNIEDVTDVTDKLKKFRQSGLESGGEYSYENLTFKLLRRNGVLTKLFDLKTELKKKKLSIS